MDLFYIMPYKWIDKELYWTALVLHLGFIIQILPYACAPTKVASPYADLKGGIIFVPSLF